MAADDVAFKTTSPRDKYPYAYSDFYGSYTTCIYKSGPEWPISKGPLTRGLPREPRPVHCHPIQPDWINIGTRICEKLESVDIMWTSVNPLAYANAGEPKPFCPLIISIGVNPGSLVYEAAVTAADLVKNILADAGFPEIEVAFIESVATHFTGVTKLLPFDPIFDRVPDVRKPFTPTLGLSIAPRKYPHYEGTAALYFRLSKDEDRVAVLTCAHVARPPSVYPNTGMTHNAGYQPREEIVVLGTMGYDSAVSTMMVAIGSRLGSIKFSNNALRSLGDPVEGEKEAVTKSRNMRLNSVARATREIQWVKSVHTEVVEDYTTFNQRAIGLVLHSEKIEVSVDERHKFTKDWALIELYNQKFDWTTFKGNKVWIGGRLSHFDYGNAMFPPSQDRKGYKYPQDGLLQAYDFVREAEIHNPQHLDAHGEKCLFVVKNGLATGTTVGRVNGLESFRRVYEGSGISQTSLEIAVLPYDHKHGQFADAGDSGSVVLDRDGRIVGIITGGSGPTNDPNITYVTPYWWLEEQIKAKFPDCFLYEVVQ